MSDVELKAKETLDDKLVVCRCEEFLLSQMHEMLSDNPEMTFDNFLEASNVGSRCTACLLDLEYYFIRLPRGKPSAKSKKAAQQVDQNLPWRRKLYRFIDRWSPIQPLVLPNHVPVVFGKGIEQWLWLANYTLDYDKGTGAPDFDIFLTMYDSQGNVIWRDQRILPTGGEIREELTQHIPAGSASGSNADDLSVCWLDVTRRARSMGVRGTTRPQIEIVTPVSSCAVHGQAAGYNNGCPFDLVCCPDDDRTFVSIINAGDTPLKLEFSYPSDPLKRIDLPARKVEVSVPAHGVRLQEIILEDKEKAAFNGRLFRFAWKGAGVYKAHVFVASKNLDRFSVDHS